MVCLREVGATTLFGGVCLHSNEMEDGFSFNLTKVEWKVFVRFFFLVPSTRCNDNRKRADA